jgi:hypothetical protein
MVVMTMSERREGHLVVIAAATTTKLFTTNRRPKLGSKESIERRLIGSR